MGGYRGIRVRSDMRSGPTPVGLLSDGGRGGRGWAGHETSDAGKLGRGRSLCRQPPGLEWGHCRSVSAVPWCSSLCTVEQRGSVELV
jgi:hypothetical protein